MTICTDDIINELTRSGHYEAITVIKGMLNKDKVLNSRWRLYHNRMNEFAKNFGVWVARVSKMAYREYIELEYEVYGHDSELEKLAKNINGDYYESMEEDVCAEFDADGNSITVNKDWFDLIMHLWINKYKDTRFDIYQSKLC